MHRSDNDLPFTEDLERQWQAVLFLDVVESVRIMERYEGAFVRAWLAFLAALKEDVLLQWPGRLVKSHGDGALLSFDSAARAVGAAMHIQRAVQQLDTRMPADAPIRLRIGIHLTMAVVQEGDLFGAGVNLAARLASLADPGDILLSSAARETLVDGHGFELTDQGDHWLKHLSQAVRVFRVECQKPAITLGLTAFEHRPGIAVLPFKRLLGGDPLPGLGQALADDLTTSLSRSARWRVISRASTTRCQCYAPDQRLADLLGVPYLVSGSFRNEGHRVALHVELCDARRDELVWSEQYRFRVADLFAQQDQAMHDVVRAIGRQVLNIELKRAGSLPFSRLEDYSLHLSAIALMHRLTRAEFERAGTMIDALEERHRRSPEPPAMRARWHALRMVQHWAVEGESVGGQALESARLAVVRDPTHAFALPMAALLAAQNGEPLLPALAGAQLALATHPQEPMAGLAFALIRGYMGDADDFERHATEAVGLTPLDPALYVYLSMLASAKISNGKFEQGIEIAARALRANATYSSAHLMMTLGLAMAGRLDQARQSAVRLRSLEPSFRVSRYMEEFNGRRPPGYAAREHALLAAGLPA